MWAGTSCSDLGVLSPPEQGAVAIGSLSLSEGSFASPGQAVRFVIQAPETRGTEARILQLEVSLQDALGNSVWSAEVASPVANEELSMTLPTLPSGRYILSLRIIGEEGLLHERKLGFFCLAGEYAITGISSYPPTIMPNREGRITAEFLYPDGSDPYVRWSRDGMVLARGRVSEGLAELTWPAPREEGVYTVQVELFPVPPPAGSDFPTVSPIASAARLFVSSKRAQGADELGPQSSYFVLFHFDGSLQDEAAGGGQAELTGSARLADTGTFPGYLLPDGSGAGIRYARSILPVVDGRLQPCTVTLALVPAGQEAAQGTNLLSVVLAEQPEGTDGALGGRWAFRLLRGPDGEFQALIGTPDRQVRLPSGFTSLPAGRMSRLDLSLVPGATSLQAIWFLDGLQTAAHEVSFGSELPAAGGQTLLGGEDNLGVVVTELGVYYRDESRRPTVDPGIFRAAAEARYAGRLILAEGFEGLYPPDSWTLSGEARPDRGLLLLRPQASVRLPYFELGSGETVVSVLFAADPPGDSSVSLFWEDQDRPFAVAQLRGLLLDPSRPQQAVTVPPFGSRLELALSAGSLRAAGAEAGAAALSLNPPAATASWLTLQVEAPSAGQAADDGRPLSLDSVLIYRN